MDFGAAVVAESLGIPHACIVVIGAGGFVRAQFVAEPLTLLRAEHGLEADPELEMLHRYLTLVPVPPSYRDPRYPCRPPLTTCGPHCSTSEEAPMAPIPVATQGGRLSM